MARALFTVVCRKASVEASTNILSIFEVLEQLTLPPNATLAVGAVNILGIDFNVVTLWERTDPAVGERFEARFRILAPDGAQLVEGMFNVDMTGHSLARTIGVVQGWPYAGPGIYRCVAEARRGHEWEPMGDFPITVFGPALGSAP